MKKSIYYRTCFNGGGKPPIFKQSEGTKELFAVPGTDLKIAVFFEKTAGEWLATEETSGLIIVRGGSTKKDCMSRITFDMLRAIPAKLENNKYVTLLSEYRRSINA